MFTIGIIIITFIINGLMIGLILNLFINNPLNYDTLLSVIIFILATGYFDYLVIESLINKTLRKKFKYVIHVNGIRGKSTTTRLIDAGLRNCGFKVFSKTTGTVPTIINVNNEEIKIKRLGNANIREQLRMVKKAYKEGADVLVLECMAVNPELQYICEKHILNADVTIITNVRPDHIQDMGETLEDIAVAFSNTIPANGHLVVNDSHFNSFFLNKAKLLNTKVHISKPYEGTDLLSTFKDNIEVALEVAECLNLDKNTFFEGMKNYHHDIGAFEAIKYGENLFLNGFSINDPVSIKVVYDEITKRINYQDITILLNNRNDRPTRILQHIEMLKDLPCKKILIFGSNTKYVKEKIKKEYHELDVDILKNIDTLKNEKIIFGVGNIGGKGMKIIEYFREIGERV